MSKKVKDFGIEKSLKNLGIKDDNKGTSVGGKYFASGKVIESYSPVDGKLIAKVKTSNEGDYEKVIQSAQKAFQEFRLIPAPKRGGNRKTIRSKTKRI
ncbi:aldehyde dehydrogenase family protein [Chryseobacterium proteolyticum]|uniref:aldehyde dehydrogenase family protein n=1 Tax=Chryseobacterium proteolyticum TaxID=118127 RepID=UPI0039830F7F